MALNCENIQLKEGSKGNTVLLAQTNLNKLGFYTAKLDGVYGKLTVESVKSFQKKYNLLQDGIIGPVTCKKINSLVNSSNSKVEGVYTSKNHWVSVGCNKLGQCTSYYCAPHSIRQCNSKINIDKYTEGTLAGYCGTTTAGTSHNGIETCLRKIALLTGKKINVTWKHFSELGKDSVSRWTALGKLIEKDNTGVIVHNLYRNKWGHYEVIKEININKKWCIVLNSLGSKCGSTGYCGELETRSFNTFESYIRGISQKSICIIEYI